MAALESSPTPPTAESDTGWRNWRGYHAHGSSTGYSVHRAEQLRAAAGADLDQLATKPDLAIISAKLGVVQWVMAFQAALIVAMAARLFGIV